MEPINPETRPVTEGNFDVQKSIDIFFARAKDELKRGNAYASVKTNRGGEENFNVVNMGDGGDKIAREIDALINDRFKDLGLEPADNELLITTISPEDLLQTPFPAQDEHKQLVLFDYKSGGDSHRIMLSLPRETEGELMKVSRATADKPLDANLVFSGLKGLFEGQEDVSLDPKDFDQKEVRWVIFDSETKQAATDDLQQVSVTAEPETHDARLDTGIQPQSEDEPQTPIEPPDSIAPPDRRRPIWGDWLYNEENQFTNVDFPQLDRMVSRLARRPSNPAIETESALSELYIDIEALLDDDSISPEQQAKAAFFLERVIRRIEHLQTQSETSELQTENENPAEVRIAKELKGIENDSPEIQRNRVRRVLDEIEGSNDRLESQNNSPKLAEIDVLIKNQILSEPLIKEIHARLSLHEFAVSLRRVGGKTEDKIALYRAILAEATANGYLLEGEDFHTLFNASESDGDPTNNGLVEIPVRAAYSLLQHAAVDGMVVGRAQNGDAIRKSIIDGRITVALRDAMRNRIIAQLGGDANAIKAMELAERIADVTFDSSLWRMNAPPTYPLAQIFYFSRAREDDATDTGPGITKGLIGGFGTSFFRNARGGGEWAINHNLRNRINRELSQIKQPNYIGHRLLRSIAESPEGFVRKRLDLIRMNQALNRINDLIPGVAEAFQVSQVPRDYRELSLIDHRQIDFRSFSVGEYAKFLGGTVPGYLKVADLLLKSDWKPDDFSIDNATSWKLPFEKVDPPLDKDNPKGSLFLRELFIMGALDEAFKQYERLGWGQLEITQAINNIINSEFLTAEQIYEVTDILKLTGPLGYRPVVADFVQGARGTTRVRR